MPPVVQAKSTGMHSKRTRVRTADYPSGGTIPTAQDMPTPNVLFSDVISVSVPGPVIGETKVTHLDSPGGYHEWVPGFGDGDTVTVNLNYSKSVYIATAAYVPQLAWDETLPAEVAKWGPPAHGRRLWEVEFPDGKKVRFLGFVKQHGVEAPEDDRITAADLDEYQRLVDETPEDRQRGVILTVALGDETGRPLFTADQAGDLAQLESAAVNRVIRTFNRLNGLVETETGKK